MLPPRINPKEESRDGRLRGEMQNTSTKHRSPTAGWKITKGTKFHLPVGWGKVRAAHREEGKKNPCQAQIEAAFSEAGSLHGI